MIAALGLLDHISVEWQNLLRVIYGQAHEMGRWPNWHYVDRM